MAALTIAVLAQEIGAQVEGDASAVITGIASIRDAFPGQLTFLANMKYAGWAAGSKASALIVPLDWNHESKATLLKVERPDEAFMKVARHFMPPDVDLEPGVHPMAVVDPSARLGAGVRVGPHVTIAAGAVIGANVRVYPGCYIGHNAEIGDDCLLYPNVVLRESCRLGKRVILHSGTVIGADGFGYVVDDKGVRTKVPQKGIVVVGDDVEMGSNVSVDRARFGQTVIGKGVKIDNLVQIAHNVVIGDHAVIVAQVGISGSTEVGAHAIMAGQSGVAGHLTIGAGAIVGAQAGVTDDVAPKEHVMGFPAIAQRDYLRIYRQYLRLPDLRDRIAQLEKEVAALKQARS